MASGDIGADFLSSYLPELVEVAKPTRGSGANESISAEGMSILHSYRATHYPADNNVFTQDSRRLLLNILEAERSIVGVKRPALHSHIRDLVIQSAIDLPWLREECGVKFDGVNYQTIGGVEGKPYLPANIEDICLVDCQVRRQINDHVLRQLL